MAREIIRQTFTRYLDLSESIGLIDESWFELNQQLRFTLISNPGLSFYVNAIEPSIEGISGPYKIFSTNGALILNERSNVPLVIPESLFDRGPLIVYIHYDQSKVAMAFISKEAITDPFTETPIVVARSRSSITIFNTTNDSIFYSYANTPNIPIDYKEIASQIIEVYEPRSIGYLYLVTQNQSPIQVSTTNTRTKVVNDNFLLIVPNNFSAAQAAKFTGNPISTISEAFDLSITI